MRYKQLLCSCIVFVAIFVSYQLQIKLKTSITSKSRVPRGTGWQVLFISIGYPLAFYLLVNDNAYKNCFFFDNFYKIVLIKIVKLS